MSLAIVCTRAQVGINAPEVHVEVHLSGGLPSFAVVGLPETAVKESRERVRSALINSGFDFPQLIRSEPIVVIGWLFWRQGGSVWSWRLDGRLAKRLWHAQQDLICLSHH